MLNILIVDDSVLMINNIRAYAENLGHYVIGEARNGEEAVELCSKLNPDLVTMDITMPNMDGLTAISKIKEFNENVNIIVVTSHGQEEIIMRALQAGAKGYILKPVSETNLNKTIDSIYNDNITNKEEYLLDD